MVSKRALVIKKNYQKMGVVEITPKKFPLGYAKYLGLNYDYKPTPNSQIYPIPEPYLFAPLSEILGKFQLNSLE